MSTSAASYQFTVERSELPMAGLGEVRVIHSYGEAFAGSEAVTFRSASKSRATEVKQRKPTLNVRRRLKGFLVELQRNEARVGFLDGDQVIYYDLPAEQIRRAGIEIRNQPFQMDEIDTEDEDGNFIIGYRFLPLAQKSDGFIETLNFDDERKRKRELILKEFRKTQG
jgi:hypothetical protein